MSLFVTPDINQCHPGGAVIRHIHTRWPVHQRPPTAGHYTALRQRLDTSADRLAATIDDANPLVTDNPGR